MSFICRICLEGLQNKTAVSTTCGHIFCAECATHHWQFAHNRPICPVCRSPQTFDQLIRLFPEYGTTSEDPLNVPTMPVPQANAPQMPQPPLIPHPYPPADLANFPQPTPPTQPIPPSHVPSTPPPPPARSGARDVATLRISLSGMGSRGFPWAHAGSAPTSDQDRSPIFLGVAAFRDGMHPCKIRPSCSPMTWVSYGGKEYAHTGAAYLLPFDRSAMEWVPASDGRVPPGRTPVDGGFEQGGRQKLFHALALVQGVKVPGKTGTHIKGANVPFGNREVQVRSYEILCWRD